MLGGLEEVHGPDVRDSLAFIQKLRADSSLKVGLAYACDCGAGIGRVTKYFLTTQFDKVDLVEQNSKFLDTAATSYLREEKESGKVGDMFPVGLQNFTPANGKYDVIWCQWVLSHLTTKTSLRFSGDVPVAWRQADLSV
ncbi:alpha-N-methyltransferase NTM1 [Kickxella alabastrina]|uniref:alpha-N-methyltransferase NTM1 n=1 Tax=Kickxella alabastrina TaxID=61397 RepID=UPI00221FD90C|nr:alpha-N-methyltransferase NTM1 [Kickxella alabastrina]KAI7831929.1 alpha-N-methyltransferase NTM1 [Kickxella alabastrina]